MINSVTVTNFLGEELELDLRNPEKSGFAVYSIEGIGPDEATINIKDVATYDGGKFNSARLKIRDVKMKLLFVGIDIETIRQKSYKYFPTKKLLKLTFHTDNRDCYLCGYVEENEPTIFSTKSSKAGCNISITCADPYVYSVDDMVTIFSGIVPEFEFPFENNDPIEPLIEMGNVVTKQYESVRYEGEIDTGVIVTVHTTGTVGDLRIYNVTKRQTMTITRAGLIALTGSGLVANDTITINTIRGQKSIELLRNGIRTNILNCLGKSIEWFTISKGDNIFTYVAEEGASNVQFRISSKIVYEGV